MMLSIIPLLLALHAPHVPAPPGHLLLLSTNTYHANRPGGRSSSSGKALEQNKTTPFVTYTTPSMCGFAAGGFTETDPSATLGWEVVVVPKVVRPGEVVLNVTWTRERNHKVEARGTTEVLMRPGDIVPLDVAGTPESRSAGCQMTSAELVLELEPPHWANLVPSRGGVVSTDMWLVRKLPDGKEDTHQINVRGALNEQVPFYFDDTKSGDRVMSVLGRIRARETENGLLSLEFEGERQVRVGTESLGRGFTSVAPGSGTLILGSDQDVVSVEFPISPDPKWKELGSQPLSIRIRMRRIR